MSVAIGAEAAKLAGLQIDALSKIRNGKLSLEHLERFLNLSPEVREERFAGRKTPGTAVPAALTEKFALLADLGTITVPEDYKHKTALTRFLEENRNKFRGISKHITDANFANPTRVLKPGDKFKVRVFKQTVDGTTTSEERLAFLATQKVVHVGAQGLSLVFDQKREQLPRDYYWYVSLDEPNRLWQDADGDHRVPCLLNRYSDGGFDFALGSFEHVWGDGDCLLCFCGIE